MNGVYLTSNEDEAWEMIAKLDRCPNCVHYTRKDLFIGKCGYSESYPEGCDPFNVGNDDTCECFCPSEKKVKYWIDKLVEMALEAAGVNDFNRQLAYQQANGTDYEFLGLEKPEVDNGKQTHP